MVTFPSNSSMKAKNINRPSPATPSSGAAARRRLRHLTSSNSNNSLMGGGENEHSPTSVSSSSSSFRGGFRHSGRSDSQGSLVGGRDHVIHYAQSTTTTTTARHRNTTTIPPTPVSRSNSVSSSSSNIFTMEDSAGFTFDAFGLDETQVDREVDAAIRDLAGSHPDLFEGMNVSDEEFPPVSFDSPPGSRRNSPLLDDDDGFHVTGAGLAGLPTIHVRHHYSPASSDRSSLTSSNEAHPQDAGQVNMFKMQAGFHASKGRRRQQQQQQHEPLSNWAEFDGRPPMSPPLTTKSEPGAAANKFIRAPTIPNIVGSLTTEQLEEHETTKETRAAPQDRSEAGAPSSTGAPSEVAVASDMGVASNVGDQADYDDLPFEVVSSKKKGKSTNVSTERDQNDESPIEQERPGSVTNLKEAWEQREIEELDRQEQRRLERQRARSPLDLSDIERIQTQLGDELLTPETIEKRWPKAGPRFPIVKKELEQPHHQRALECAEQRTSFASHKARLRSTTSPRNEGAMSSSKSDFQGYRTPSSDMKSVLSRMNHVSSEAKSDVGGSTPAYLSKVKLRSTGGVANFDERQRSSPSTYSDEWNDDQTEEWNVMVSDQTEEWNQMANSDSDALEEPPQPKLTYRERRELELRRQQEIEQRADVRSDGPQPKKMTYKERREMELRQQQSEEVDRESLNKQPERDVAALIRRRIAANKKNAMQSEFPVNSNEPEDVISARSKLKKVSLDDGKSPLADTNDLAALRSVAAKYSAPPEDSQTAHSVDSATNHHSVEKPNSRELGGSPTMPSMVSSEVDSSSTARTHPELAPASTKPEQSTHREMLSNQIPNIPEKEAHDSSGETEAPPAAAKSTKAMLNSFFANRLGGAPAMPGQAATESKDEPSSNSGSGSPARGGDDQPALKDDPKYDRYFRMLKVGMPMEVVKHAMTRDGVDPSVMDGDHNKPAGQGGVPLKEDPKYTKYFKMLKMGLPMGAVKNAMERDGMDPAVMDGDHNLPAGAGMSSETKEKFEEEKPKDTHRRTRLHWETLRKVRSNSVWAKIDNDPEVEQIDIDEEEFAELFQAELTPVQVGFGKAGGVLKKRGAAVRVIDAKRANNGGIILARLKMTHDDMADAVDRIDGNGMTAEQMQNIIEYLPTKEESKALEAYMLEGGQDAAEKFDGLCECEKFMVSMMTVKHAKRKVRALLFRLQFQGFLDSLQKEADLIETSCDELSNSVRLRKLLGIVLNLGNKLNTSGTHSKRKAGAFTLNSLLKLSHAKAFDRKTTFLDYVVLVVQRNNEILLRFKDDIPTALKADKVYWDQCLSDLENLENQLENVRRIALHQARLQQIYRLKKKKKPRNEMDEDSESLSDLSMSLEEEVNSLRATQIGIFTLGAIKKVSTLRDKVETTKKKFARLQEYFGEEDKRDMQPHELFNIIATFSRDFDKSKERVFSQQKLKQREERKQKASDKALNKPPTPSNGRLPRQPHPSRSAPPKLNSSAQRHETNTRLRSSNLQPNMSTVLKDVTARTPSPRSAQGQSHPQTSRSSPSRSPHAAADSSALMQSSRPSPSPRSAMNSSSSRDAGFQEQRPPVQQSQLLPRSGDSASKGSTAESSSSLRSRTRAHGLQSAKTAKSIASSAASTTQPSTRTSPQDGRPPLQQQPHVEEQLSPRSSIRQRRRMEQRKASRTDDFLSDEFRLEMD